MEPKISTPLLVQLIKPEDISRAYSRDENIHQSIGRCIRNAGIRPIGPSELTADELAGFPFPSKVNYPNGQFATFESSQSTKELMSFLEHDHANVVRDIISNICGRKIELEDIDENIYVSFVKFGFWERIFQVIVSVKDEPHPFVMAFHTPRDQLAEKLMKNDANNQRILYAQDPRFLPEPYGVFRTPSQNGQGVFIFANEWIEGFFETHVDSTKNDNRFIVWRYVDGVQSDINLSEGDSREIALQIYMILTVYSDLTLRAVRINAGDFAVKILPQGRLEVRLISTRVLARKSKQRMDFDKKSKDVTLPISDLVEQLGSMFELRIEDYDIAYVNQERDLFIRFADFETVIDGFKRGIGAILIRNDMPKDDVEAAAVQATNTILNELLEKHSVLTNDYVEQHWDDIVSAISSFKEKHAV